MAIQSGCIHTIVSGLGARRDVGSLEGNIGLPPTQKISKGGGISGWGDEKGLGRGHPVNGKRMSLHSRGI